MLWREGRAMTEAQWPACEDLVVLLEALLYKASARKLRLYAALGRMIWGRLEDARSRLALEPAEQAPTGS
jgi:hypothetical protein